ncbi:MULTISPECIES: hypothetical protein [Halorussus]|uniref:hypothetical protein n=1 Tax=Halorussus TaxID=1070314 RepID=UPI00209F044D|nr:hypothetical protein [Halorussus vallis]USZ78657.1 hypothetical protein NGM07_25245 [Halorussus vallis]USZ78688.1 hypothetical protein NGM07_24570 [Halorussus vallis]
MAHRESDVTDEQADVDPRDDQDIPDFADLLSRDNGLRMNNDLDYLLGLTGEALRSEEFDTDRDRAKWVVAQWSQELLYTPDLREYTPGKCVPKGNIPENRW